MFEDLNWKSAIRRAAFAALLYLLFVYILGVAYPDTFGAGGMNSAVVVAAVFFFFYAILFAFTDRSKRRRSARMKAESKGKNPKAKATGTDAGGDEEAGAGDLKGRHNPNTSRRKTTRRRRR
ncbi:hypothetical protein BH24ACT19_BH24ACT19_15700 [soil metagenome]